jgi:hypothetical protein
MSIFKAFLKFLLVVVMVSLGFINGILYNQSKQPVPMKYESCLEFNESINRAQTFKVKLLMAGDVSCTVATGSLAPLMVAPGTPA